MAGGAGAIGIRGGSPPSPNITLRALMFGKSELLWDTIESSWTDDKAQVWGFQRFLQLCPKLEVEEAIGTARRARTRELKQKRWLRAQLVPLQASSLLPQQQWSRTWCCRGAGPAPLRWGCGAMPGEQGWGTQGSRSLKSRWQEAGHKGGSWAWGPLLQPSLFSATGSSWEHSCWMTFPKALRKGGEKNKKGTFFPNINSCNIKNPTQ